MQEQSLSQRRTQMNKLLGALGDLTRVAFPVSETHGHSERLTTLCDLLRNAVGADLVCLMHTPQGIQGEVKVELAIGKAAESIQVGKCTIVKSNAHYIMPDSVKNLGMKSSRAFPVSGDLQHPTLWLVLFWESAAPLADDIEEFLKSASHLVRTEVHMRDVDESREWLSNRLDQEKRAHARARENLDRVLRVEKLFRTIGNTIPYGVFVTDADGVPNYVSSSFLDMIGMSIEQYRRFEWQELLHPNDRELVVKTWVDAVHGGKPWSCEFQIFGRDHQLKTIMGRGAPFFDDRGHVLGYTGVNFDITDRKLAEDQLRESEERYRQIVDVASEGIWKLDVFGKTKFTNNSLSSILGFSADDFAETSIWDYMNPECTLSFNEAWQSVLRFDQRKIDCSFICKNGRKIWAYISLSPIADPSGQISGVLALVTDVTYRHQVEDELKAAKASAEAANEAKSQFLANMSHEIRTPLTAVLGFGELLLEQDLSESERREAAEAIGRNGRLLLNLINDILDLSKVEAGRLNIETMPFSVHELCDEIKTSFKPQADSKGLNFTVERTKDVPESICSDPTRVRQILLNLIGNAFKFTQKGEVKVDCRMENRNLVIAISDTGPGIKNADVTRLFEPFSQADATITRRFGGTGLGLILSRNLARSLSGDVRLTQSIDGKGSTFEVSLPVDLACSVESRKPQDKHKQNSVSPLVTEKLRGTKILIVDDSADNRLLVKKMLKPYGIEIEMAPNGRIGVDAALAGDHDLVFMDIQMPEMDGYEATEKLRSLGYKKPIIALTAHAMKEERDATKRVGCTDHVTKPLNRQQLLNTIWNYSQH